jgi:hypothetical protein
MIERPGPERSSPSGEGPKRRLDGLVSRTRAALWWEAAWPLTWRALGVVLVFLPSPGSACGSTSAPWPA